MNKNQKKVTYPYFSQTENRMLIYINFHIIKRIFVHWQTIEDNGDKNDQ